MIFLKLDQKDSNEMLSKHGLDYLVKIGKDIDKPETSSKIIELNILLRNHSNTKDILKKILPKFIDDLQFSIKTDKNNFFKFYDSDKLKTKIKPKGFLGYKNTFNGKVLNSSIYKNNIGNWSGYGNDSTLVLFSENGLIFTTFQGYIVEDVWEIIPTYDKVENCLSVKCNMKVFEDYEFTDYVDFKSFISIFKNCVIKETKKFFTEGLSKFSKKEENKKIELLDSKTSLMSKLDKDNNGTIDIVEEKNEFNLILKKHQKIVIEKGKEFNQNYTHQFIKVGNYIKQKRNNLQLIFDCIKQVQNQKDLDEYVVILESEIHSYNLLLINSLNLVVSLIEDDQITFYDIYERFDKLNIYNSNWENEISQKLTTLNKGISELNSNIKDLMYEIREMGETIISSIEDLSYITEESTRMLDNRLGEIDSSIKTNNLLTLIQTYQTYKINKNTKSLKD